MTKVIALMVAVVVLAGCEESGSNLCLKSCGSRGVKRYAPYGLQTSMVCECGDATGCPAQDGGAK